jgi:uncharacterized Zn-finger protein
MAQPAPQPPEIIEVDTKTVSCDGGGGALGHPRIYMNLSVDGKAECGYCDRQFVLKPGMKLSDAH